MSTKKIKKQHPKPILTLKLGVLVGVAVVFCLTGEISANTITYSRNPSGFTISSPVIFSVDFDYNLCGANGDWWRIVVFDADDIPYAYELPPFVCDKTPPYESAGEWEFELEEGDYLRVRLDICVDIECGASSEGGQLEYNGGLAIFTILPSSRVWVVSPASGGTTTSTDFNFIVGWEGWDFEDIYKDFIFSFYEKNTGILTGTKIYEPLTENGTTSLSLADFGIEKNGDYYFHAKARSYLYEYTAYYTEDLVLPEWWVNVDVAGWEAIFEMPATTTWYAAHSKFATATAGFLTITNFLAPVYNKLGEFGNRAVEFLNIEDAYDRGYDLGKIIPTYTQYITGIEVFFGGFPIMTIFTSFLAILLGIFIGRLILKFVPFIGK